MSTAKHAFELTGGALCLDFANTLGDRPRCAEEHLVQWSDVVEWGRQTGVLSSREATALQGWAAQHERQAASALETTKALRETIYRIFSALAAGRTAPATDLAALNEWVRESLRHLHVAARGGEYVWAWDADAVPARVLWPVARSAGDLLVSTERPQLRECQSDACSWLFVDRSRTKQRRWCSMRTCGNRAKVRRFHERQREARIRS